MVSEWVECRLERACSRWQRLVATPDTAKLSKDGAALQLASLGKIIYIQTTCTCSIPTCTCSILALNCTPSDQCR